MSAITAERQTERLVKTASRGVTHEQAIQALTGEGKLLLLQNGFGLIKEGPQEGGLEIYGLRRKEKNKVVTWSFETVTFPKLFLENELKFTDSPELRAFCDGHGIAYPGKFPPSLEAKAAFLRDTLVRKNPSDREFQLLVEKPVLDFLTWKPEEVYRALNGIRATQTTRGIKGASIPLTNDACGQTMLTFEQAKTLQLPVTDELDLHVHDSIHTMFRAALLTWAKAGVPQAILLANHFGRADNKIIELEKRSVTEYIAAKKKEGQTLTPVDVQIAIALKRMRKKKEGINKKETKEQGKNPLRRGREMVPVTAASPESIESIRNTELIQRIEETVINATEAGLLLTEREVLSSDVIERLELALDTPNYDANDRNQTPEENWMNNRLDQLTEQYLQSRNLENMTRSQVRQGLLQTRGVDNTEEQQAVLDELIQGIDTTKPLIFEALEPTLQVAINGTIFEGSQLLTLIAEALTIRATKPNQDKSGEQDQKYLLLQKALGERGIHLACKRIDSQERVSYSLAATGERKSYQDFEQIFNEGNADEFIITSMEDLEGVFDHMSFVEGVGLTPCHQHAEAMREFNSEIPSVIQQAAQQISTHYAESSQQKKDVQTQRLLSSLYGSPILGAPSPPAPYKPSSLGGTPSDDTQIHYDSVTFPSLLKFLQSQQSYVAVRYPLFQGSSLGNAVKYNSLSSHLVSERQNFQSVQKTEHGHPHLGKGVRTDDFSKGDKSVSSAVAPLKRNTSYDSENKEEKALHFFVYGPRGTGGKPLISSSVHIPRLSNVFAQVDEEKRDDAPRSGGESYPVSASGFSHADPLGKIGGEQTVHQTTVHYVAEKRRREEVVSVEERITELTVPEAVETRIERVVDQSTVAPIQAAVLEEQRREEKSTALSQGSARVSSIVVTAETSTQIRGTIIPEASVASDVDTRKEQKSASSKTTSVSNQAVAAQEEKIEQARTSRGWVAASPHISPQDEKVDQHAQASSQPRVISNAQTTTLALSIATPGNLPYETHAMRFVLQQLVKEMQRDMVK